MATSGLLAACSSGDSSSGGGGDDEEYVKAFCESSILLEEALTNAFSVRIGNAEEAVDGLIEAFD
jgi:hypothetical protein